MTAVANSTLTNSGRRGGEARGGVGWGGVGVGWGGAADGPRIALAIARDLTPLPIRYLCSPARAYPQVMREIAGKALSDKQLQEAFSAVDTDGNGMVSWDEFLEGQQELRKWKQKRKPKSRRKTAEA
jgi:hypothetical protein